MSAINEHVEGICGLWQMQNISEVPAHSDALMIWIMVGLSVV